MWQYGGETNLIRSNQVAGKTVDQNYMLVDYPAMIKSKGLNGHTDLKYDVNGDGAVNSKDIIAEMKAIAAGKTDSEFDLNGDGKVNSKDTVSIIDVYKRQIKSGLSIAKRVLQSNNREIDRILLHKSKLYFMCK